MGWQLLLFALCAVCAPANDNPGAEPIRVALFAGSGASDNSVARLERVLGGEQDIELRRVDAEVVLSPALASFDVLLFPGGSGSAQAHALGEEGRARVRQFVREGGGYVGICAGAYLACEGFSWGLKILDAKTVSPKWRRGKATVKIELTEAGRALFGDLRGLLDIAYQNGPIIEPAGARDIPDYEVLAWYRSEVAKNNTPKGVMVNSPAIVCARYGRGRVLCFSAHPEKTPGLESFVARAIRWAAAGSDAPQRR